MNLNRTLIAFPQNMKVFLPDLKENWVQYLLLRNNNNDLPQNYELHIPESIPLEIGENGDELTWSTEYVEFEGQLINSDLFTNKTHHVGTLVFKTAYGFGLIHCSQSVKSPF